MATVLALLLISSASALVPARAATVVQSHKEAIVVELKIEDYMDFMPIEVPIGRSQDAGGGVGCGGGLSPPKSITGYRCGLSVVALKKRSAIVHLTVTIRYESGEEESIDEQFLVTRRQERQYSFAYGISVKARFQKKAIKAKGLAGRPDAAKQRHR